MDAKVSASSIKRRAPTAPGSCKGLGLRGCAGCEGDQKGVVVLWRRYWRVRCLCYQVFQIIIAFNGYDGETAALKLINILPGGEQDIRRQSVQYGNKLMCRQQRVQQDDTAPTRKSGRKERDDLWMVAHQNAEDGNFAQVALRA